MNKQQIILSVSGAALVATLFLFGKTVPSKNKTTENSSTPQSASTTSVLTIDSFLVGGKNHLTPSQLSNLQKIEKKATQGNSITKEGYESLAKFWKDSAKLFEPYAYYNAQAALLENSEKNLTFAAHLFITDLPDERDPKRANFYAANAKVLFEKALKLNPDNDSSIVGLGMCYMFGGISDNPMQGITTVLEVAKKNPDNMYAQRALALGGLQSGQVDKAIERFNIILEKQPENIEAILRLADVYERKHDDAKAIALYNRVLLLNISPVMKQELEEHIAQLKNHQH